MEIKKPWVVGFCGRKRVGKSVLANVFKERYGYEIVSMATPLKLLCCEILGCELCVLNVMKNDNRALNVEVDDRIIDIVSRRTKISRADISKHLSGVTFTSVRQMLQVVGTDCIRKCYPGWHVDETRKIIKEKNLSGKKVVVDDVRFPNEKRMVEDFDGECYFIIRMNFEDISNHESETALTFDGFAYEDRLIINDKKSADEFLNDFISEYEDERRRGDVIVGHGHPMFNCNWKFGRELTRYVSFLIKQNADNDCFIKRGTLTVEVRRYEDFVELITDYLGSRSLISPFDYVGMSKYAIHNPLITENLKRHA